MDGQSSAIEQENAQLRQQVANLTSEVESLRYQLGETAGLLLRSQYAPEYANEPIAVKGPPCPRCRSEKTILRLVDRTAKCDQCEREWSA